MLLFSRRSNLRSCVVWSRIGRELMVKKENTPYSCCTPVLLHDFSALLAVAGVVASSNMDQVKARATSVLRQDRGAPPENKVRRPGAARGEQAFFRLSRRDGTIRAMWNSDRWDNPDMQTCLVA